MLRTVPKKVPQRSSRGARGLPREAFTCPDIYRRETDLLFRRRWLLAARSSEIPQSGAFLVREWDDDAVVISREPEGRAVAFHNVCRHRGTRLCDVAEGQFSEGVVQCPYHAWRYRLSDGALLGAPNMKGVEGFDKSAHGLLPVACREWEGFLFVHLGPQPSSFQQAFDPLLERFAAWDLASLRIAHRRVYEVSANWKLLFQNYSECYHCPIVHPALNRLTPYRNSSNELEEGPVLGGPMRMRKAGSMTTSGQRCAAPLGDLAGDDLELVHYYTVSPSFFLSLHPDYVLVHRLERLSPRRTRIVCDWLFAPESTQREGFDPSPAVEFWDLTNRQDWQVCELSQKGVSSPAYVPGPYSDLESVVAAFDRDYRAAMSGAIES